jgi:deoxyadenosine/deoxycytidine kinase
MEAAIRTRPVSEPKFIILEGVDRSGKDSMQDAIDKATKYKHMIMDRGPIGFKAYCEIYNKPTDLFDSYQKMELDVSTLPDVLVIYIDCSTEVLIERCVKTEHEILDFDRHKRIYSYHYRQSPIPRIMVDTTNKNVTEIVQELILEGTI